MSFTVHYFYLKISSFRLVLSVTIVLVCFQLAARFLLEKLSVDLMLTFAVRRERHKGANSLK